MAQAEHQTIYDVDAQQLMQAVMDYERYPEFVDGMRKVSVDRSEKGVTAHYDLSMMGKDMSYTLKLTEEPEKGHLSWTLLSSEFFKINNGDWLIESVGPGKCKARYFSEVDFTFPVPGFVLKPMVKNAVPKMMDSFYERAKKLPKPEPQPQVQQQQPPKQQLKQEQQDQPKAESPIHQSTQERVETMNVDSGIMSWAKKIMTVGVGTFFLTEESLRSIISEFKLPKEMVASLLDGAKNVRQEFIQNVTQEVIGRISDKMDPSAVLAEFLKNNEVTFEIKIKVKDKSNSSA